MFGGAFAMLMHNLLQAEMVNQEETGYIREQSFLILGTRVEDFRQGYETFFHHFTEVRNFQGNFLCGTNPFYWKMVGHNIFFWVQDGV